jgi:nucleoside-diphosphate-sugar epimerase
LIVGCGDVGLRAARSLTSVRLLALTSSPERRGLLRQAGITPLLGQLDEPKSLQRLAGIAHRVLHLAPPAGEGQVAWWRDFRTQALTRVLRKRSPPKAVVYGSTSGVYGDCEGACVSETRELQPATPRAQRRVDAERCLRHLGRQGAGSGAAVRVSVLRIPGIYAMDRQGGTPRERLLRGTPVLQRKEDVFTSHIQADDLARACVLALWRGRAQRVYNINDDTELRMGDYMDLAADLFGLARPPRLARAQAMKTLPLNLLSFMGESRRLVNARMKKELRCVLTYPTVREGLQPQTGMDL